MTGLDVTPEFKAFVAKKLGEVIDRDYCCSDNKEKHANAKSNIQNDTKKLLREKSIRHAEGIRLFTKSKSNITNVNQFNVDPNVQEKLLDDMKKKRKKPEYATKLVNSSNKKLCSNKTSTFNSN
jgi:hypothetical protein